MPHRRRRVVGRRRRGRVRIRHPVLLVLGIGFCLAAVGIGVIQSRIRPIVSAQAQALACSQVTAAVEQAIQQDLADRGTDYSDFITIQRDEQGTITALTTDMSKMNLLRSQLAQAARDAVSSQGISVIRVPLGSVLDADLLWARGPALQVRILTAGTVKTAFESEFTSAGVNQTIHRIWLNIQIPLTLILPGGRETTQVDLRLCVAETVIVGQVPQAYLQSGVR